VNHVGEVSGAEVSMATLISHLNAEECQAVAAVPPDGPLRAMLEQRDVTTHRIAALRLYHTRNPFGLARQAMRVLGHRIQLGGIVERVHPHIIHANSLTAALSATTV